jgi:hypothetical protein
VKQQQDRVVEIGIRPLLDPTVWAQGLFTTEYQRWVQLGFLLFQSGFVHADRPSSHSYIGFGVLMDPLTSVNVWMYVCTYIHTYALLVRSQRGDLCGLLRAIQP